MGKPRPWPREHGAWGLLLQPFVAGAVLASHWRWELVPAFGLVLGGFLIREPLTILARDVFVRRTLGAAGRGVLPWLGCELALLAGCLAWLSRTIAPWLLGFLAAGGALFTGTAILVVLRNRQRSLVFQSASAAALGLTAPFAIFVSTGTLPAWAWALWTLLTSHAIASIFIVHARLERRIETRSGGTASRGGGAFAAQVVQLGAGGLAAVWFPLAIAPAIFSACANGTELLHIAAGRSLKEPLSRVGVRTLATAIAHTAISAASLWPAAQA